MGGRIGGFLFRKSTTISVSHLKTYRHKCVSHRRHSPLGNPLDELSGVTLKFCLHPWKAQNLDLLFLFSGAQLPRVQEEDNMAHLEL